MPSLSVMPFSRSDGLHETDAEIGRDPASLLSSHEIGNPHAEVDVAVRLRHWNVDASTIGGFLRQNLIDSIG